MAASGSILSVELNSISFNAAADTDLTLNQPTEKEYIPTSGPSMLKITKKIASIDSVTLITGGIDQLLLEDLQDSKDPISMSYTDAHGDTYSATGAINIVSKTTQENRVEITMMPALGGRWEPVLAG